MKDPTTGIDHGRKGRWNSEIKKLRDRVAELEAALRLAEWNNGGHECCPGRCNVCKQYEPDGHSDDCEIGRALPEATPNEGGET